MKKLIVILTACIGIVAGCDNAGKNTIIPIVGSSGSSSGGSSSGSSSWYTLLGYSGTEMAQSAKQTADGGYIIAGSTGEDIPSLQGKTPLNAYAGGGDMLLIKLDSSGYVSWYTFLGGTQNEYANSVQQTADKGFIIAGYTTGNIATLQGKKPLNPRAGNNEMLVVKLNSSGKVSWYTFLGSVAGNDEANSIQQTVDRGYIIAGTATENIGSLQGKEPLNIYKGNGDMLVIKLSSSGNVTWYTFLGSTTGNDTATSICQTADKGYIVAGGAFVGIQPLGEALEPRNFHTGDGSRDMMVVKLLPTGHVSWYTYLGDAGIEVANSVQDTTDGGCIITGVATQNIASLPKLIGTASPNNDFAGGSSDMIVVKLSANGYVSWYTFLGGGGGDSAYSIQQTADSGYIVAGYSSTSFTSLQDANEPLISYNGGQDCLIVKLDESGNVGGYTFLGGSGTGNEVANSIQQTADGGYIIAGKAGGYVSELGGQWPLYSYSGGDDLFIVKLNSGGGL